MREEIVIQSHNKNQAKKARRLSIAHGCKVSLTEFPDNIKTGIKQRFSCPRGVSDKLMEAVDEPSIIKRAIIPDKIKTTLGEYIIKKPRKF